jgi:putative zinc finger/helix-turn-helix YgiT family protein
MKCDVCDGNTIIVPRQRHHYVESGLTNVYLLNVDLRVCESCGEASPRIPRITELHATIARQIALGPAPLRGADIRFLRKQLGMRAREWAALLRISSVSTFSRWENDEQRPGPQSDALCRYIYFYEAQVRDNRAVPADLAERIAAVQEQAVDLTLLVDAQTHQAMWQPAGGEKALAATASAHAYAGSRKYGSLPAGRLTSVRSTVVGEAFSAEPGHQRMSSKREKGMKAA